MATTERIDASFEKDQLDLSKAQIEVTASSYSIGAVAYSLIYERNERARERALRVMLDPFFTLMENRNQKRCLSETPASPEGMAKKGKILFIGSGTCRDLEIALGRGYEVFGIDKSPAMIDIASEILIAQVAGGQVPLAVMDMLSLELDEQKFDGVILESALSHGRKADIPVILETIRQYMNPGGIALFGFRSSEKGEVYRTEDNVGVRYYNSHTDDELAGMFSRLSYRVLNVTKADHMVAGRPGHVNYWVQAKGVQK